MARLAIEINSNGLFGSLETNYIMRQRKLFENQAADLVKTMNDFLKVIHKTVNRKPPPLIDGGSRSKVERVIKKEKQRPDNKSRVNICRVNDHFFFECSLFRNRLGAMIKSTVSCDGEEKDKSNRPHRFNYRSTRKNKKSAIGRACRQQIHPHKE
ncbi:MAG: hypothetical protein WCT49_04225 [Candidatus Paceibacterota bacterium]|jgi:hypothetical protein|nr:hypothetical protein [Candidatus Paceibacterota bacterium]